MYLFENAIMYLTFGEVGWIKLKCLEFSRWCKNFSQIFFVLLPHNEEFVCYLSISTKQVFILVCKEHCTLQACNPLVHSKAFPFPLRGFPLSTTLGHTVHIKFRLTLISVEGGSVDNHIIIIDFNIKFLHLACGRSCFEPWWSQTKAYKFGLFLLR
jgi:hypothetical protein